VSSAALGLAFAGGAPDAFCFTPNTHTHNARTHAHASTQAQR
jgi:hypothetical protein